MTTAQALTVMGEFNYIHLWLTLISVNENAEGGNISSSCNISTVILDTRDSNALDFLQNNTPFAGLVLLMNII